MKTHSPEFLEYAQFCCTEIIEPLRECLYLASAIDTYPTQLEREALSLPLIEARAREAFEIMESRS